MGWGLPSLEVGLRWSPIGNSLKYLQISQEEAAIITSTEESSQSFSRTMASAPSMMITQIQVTSQHELKPAETETAETVPQMTTYRL